MDNQFPTENETWKATAIYNAVCEAAPRMRHVLVEAFKESECMEEFESRVVTYLWYEMRNVLAGVKAAGYTEQFVKEIVEQGWHNKGTVHPNTFAKFKSFMRTLIRNCHELVF